MKKIFLVFIILLSIIFVSGCENTSNQIVVELRVNELSKKLYLDKGSVIVRSELPYVFNTPFYIAYAQDMNPELYYDPEYTNKYEGEPINENVTLYQNYYLSGEYNQAVEYWVSNVGSVYRRNVEKIKYQYLEKYVLPYYKNATIDNVFFVKMLGVYNDCFVSLINDLYTGDVFKGRVKYIDIAESEFKYLNTLRIKVYKEGNFYELDEAYKNGLLEDEDVKMIEYNYNKCYLGEKDLECPKPIIKYTEEEFLYVRQLYLEYLQEQNPYTNIEIEKLRFEFLDKCNEVEFFVSYSSYPIEKYNAVGTYGFNFKHIVYAIIDNKVYFFDDAYNAGLLSKEEFDCAFESYYNRVLSMKKNYNN